MSRGRGKDVETTGKCAREKGLVMPDLGPHQARMGSADGVHRYVSLPQRINMIINL